MSPSIAVATEEDQDGTAAAAAARIIIELESKVVYTEFCLHTNTVAPANKSLNVTCYGSSSSKTPLRYLDEARLLGYILAKRGHVCINGAGSYGCMAAMNDGVYAGDGHVRGVIHEMFLADNGYFDVMVIDDDDDDDDDKNGTRNSSSKRLMRRGSSHRVFENALILNKDEHQRQRQRQQQQQQNEKDNNSNAYSRGDSSNGITKKPAPIREIIVAGGDDLQERKKFLVTNTDAVIVLPGGPGTWDELWEMACARHLNLNALPIVCVNVDGYYEPFREMLNRAYDDELIRLPPHEIVQFAASAEDAIRFVEEGTSSSYRGGHQTTATRGEQQKQQQQHQVVSSGSSGDDDIDKRKNRKGCWRCKLPWHNLALTFVAGAAFGIAIATTATTSIVISRRGR